MYDTDQSSEYSKSFQRPYNCNQPKSQASFARSRANQLDKFFADKNIKPHPQRNPEAQINALKHFKLKEGFGNEIFSKKNEPLTPKLVFESFSYKLENPVNNGSRVSRASITLRKPSNNHEINYFSDSEGLTNRYHNRLLSNKPGIRRVINRLTGQQATNQQIDR